MFGWFKKRRAREEFFKKLDGSFRFYASVDYRDLYEDLFGTDADVECVENEDEDEDEDDESEQDAPDQVEADAEVAEIQRKMICELFFFRFWLTMFAFRSLKPDHIEDDAVLNRVLGVGVAFGRRYFEFINKINIEEVLNVEFSSALDERFCQYDGAVAGGMKRAGDVASLAGFACVLTDVCMIAFVRCNFSGLGIIHARMMELWQDIGEHVSGE